MVKVVMHRDVEGDTPVGETVDVAKDRAEFLVVRGYAVYASASDAGHLPPVGGERIKGTKVGVQASKSVRDKYHVPRNQREDFEIQTRDDELKAPAGAGEAKAPAEGTQKATDDEGPKTDRGLKNVPKR